MKIYMYIYIAQSSYQYKGSVHNFHVKSPGRGEADHLHEKYCISYTLLYKLQVALCTILKLRDLNTTGCKSFSEFFTSS